MVHYFTREEAEALLPVITIILRDIQERRKEMRELEEELAALHVRAMGNGHHLHDSIARLQRELARNAQALRGAAEDLQRYGCELKDPDMGLIDFLSLRDDQEVYLCWQLGEERIFFWHHLHTGFAGRQPL